MNTKYKAIFFDLDGTLLDTSVDLTNAVNFVLEKYGYSLRSKADVISFTGNGIYELVKRSIGKNISNDMFDDIMSDFKKYYALHNMDNTVPYNGIYELLESLKNDGYKLAVVSNKIDSSVKALCKHFFNSLIHTAVGDMPGVQKKPQAGTLNIALDELGVTCGDVVYIGDSEVDVLTAQNASVRLIAASWGFRSKELLIASGAKNVADTPNDVIDILKKI